VSDNIVEVSSNKSTKVGMKERKEAKNQKKKKLSFLLTEGGVSIHYWDLIFSLHTNARSLDIIKQGSF
jgi:hypothetical protein